MLMVDRSAIMVMMVVLMDYLLERVLLDEENLGEGITVVAEDDVEVYISSSVDNSSLVPVEVETGWYVEEGEADAMFEGDAILLSSWTKVLLALSMKKNVEV